MSREHYTDDQNFITVEARHLRDGDVLSYANPRWNIRIDEVSFMRNGQVKVNLGDDGTGTDFYDPDELIQILPR